MSRGLIYLGLINACFIFAFSGGIAAGKPPRVAILGAGVAGLTAWNKLNDSGIPAVIFEKEARIGGRFESIQDPFGHGDFVNLHAALFSEDQFLLNYFREEFGAEFIKVEPSAKQRAMSTSLVSNGVERFWNEEDLMQLVFASSRSQLEAIVDSQAKVAEGKMDVSHLTVAGFLSSIGANQELTAYFKSRMVWLWGRDLNELNANHLLNWFTIDLDARKIDFWHPSDEAWRVKGGTEKLIELMAMRIPRDVIRTNSEVTAITSKKVGGPVFVTVKGQGGPKKFDFVISTLPLTALRKVDYKIAGMSPEVANAIQTSQYANVTNLFIAFKGKPWEAAGHFGFTFSSDGFVTWPVATTGENGILRVYLGGELAVQTAHLEWTGTKESKAGFADSIVRRLNNLWPKTQENYLKAGSKFMIAPALNAYAGSDSAGPIFVGNRYFDPIGGFVMAGEYNNTDGWEGYATAAVESAIKAAEYIMVEKHDNETKP